MASTTSSSAVQEKKAVCEKKTPNHTEMLVALTAEITREIKNSSEFIKLLNKNTVIAGGYIIRSLEKNAGITWHPDIDIITTDPTNIEKFLDKNQYKLDYDNNDELEIAGKKFRAYSFDADIRSIYQYFIYDNGIPTSKVDVIIIDKKYENKVADFINECFDLDFCKAYFDGTRIIGYTGQKSLKFNPTKFVQKRYPGNNEKQLAQMIKILKRVEKYQKRGYDITLE